MQVQGCSHISEPDCGVKEALAEGKISPLRYENYKLLYEELKDVKNIRKDIKKDIKTSFCRRIMFSKLLWRKKL